MVTKHIHTKNEQIFFRKVMSSLCEDQQQITFSKLNRFCHIMLDGIPNKIKWKYKPVLHCISSFEGTSHKFFYNTATRSFSSYCFTSIFTSADVIFHNILEFHSTLSERRFFHKCFFYRRIHSTLPPPSLQCPISANLVCVSIKYLQLSFLTCKTVDFTDQTQSKEGTSWNWIFKVLKCKNEMHQQIEFK